MSRPRVLVVRSGEKPFVDPAAEPRVDVDERVTHDIEAVDPRAGSLETRYDLVLFTSRIAVARALEDGAGRGALGRLVERARRGAVGEATADALRASGLPPEIVGSGSSETLLAALPERLDDVRVLLPCGQDASTALASGLTERGARVSRCVVYRKVARPPDPTLPPALLGARFAAFCATSPAAARWLLRSAGPAGTAALRAVPAVVLGDATAAFLRNRGVARAEAPAKPRFSEALALLEALACPPARK